MVATVELHDFVAAREWYGKAAALGDVGAMNNIGVLYDAGHDLPDPPVVKETLNWFDRYLGPVE